MASLYLYGPDESAICAIGSSADTVPRENNNDMIDMIDMMNAVDPDSTDGRRSTQPSIPPVADRHPRNAYSADFLLARVKGSAFQATRYTFGWEHGRCLKGWEASSSCLSVLSPCPDPPAIMTRSVRRAVYRRDAAPHFRTLETCETAKNRGPQPFSDLQSVEEHLSCIYHP